MCIRDSYIILLAGEMELTTTNKGKPCALYGGYSYVLKRQNVKGQYSGGVQERGLQDAEDL